MDDVIKIEQDIGEIAKGIYHKIRVEDGYIYLRKEDGEGYRVYILPENHPALTSPKPLKASRNSDIGDVSSNSSGI